MSPDMIVLAPACSISGEEGGAGWDRTGLVAPASRNMTVSKLTSRTDSSFQMAQGHSTDSTAKHDAMCRLGYLAPIGNLQDLATPG
jgi:hypothetical protein